MFDLEEAIIEAHSICADAEEKERADSEFQHQQWLDEEFQSFLKRLPLSAELIQALNIKAEEGDIEDGYCPIIGVFERGDLEISIELERNGIYVKARYQGNIFPGSKIRLWKPEENEVVDINFLAYLHDLGQQKRPIEVKAKSERLSQEVRQVAAMCLQGLLANVYIVRVTEQEGELLTDVVDNVEDMAIALAKKLVNKFE